MKKKKWHKVSKRIIKTNREAEWDIGLQRIYQWEWVER